MRRRHDRFALALAALLVGPLAAVGTTAAATAAPPTDATSVIGTTSAATTQAPKPFRIDLADPNDFVAQANFVQLDARPYRFVGADTLQEALRLAARSIRETGRPVGLLVWAGRHAWVMSGFQATADPLVSDDFRVTKAIVLDPLYPNGSSRWGPSPEPREAISTAVLGRQFVPRRRGTWPGAPTGTAGATLAALAGKYVIVMPYTPTLVARSGLLRV